MKLPSEAIQPLMRIAIATKTHTGVNAIVDDRQAGKTGIAQLVFGNRFKPLRIGLKYKCFSTFVCLLEFRLATHISEIQMMERKWSVSSSWRGRFARLLPCGRPWGSSCFGPPRGDRLQPSECESVQFHSNIPPLCTFSIPYQGGGYI